MNKIYTQLVVLLLLAFPLANVQAQSPKMFKYQTVVRNSNGTIVANQAVAFQISILHLDTAGLVVFRETHHKTTNNFGLVNLEIGNGLIDSGSMNTINWANGPYFVKVGFDINNGTSYIPMGTSELLSVPYALYAEKAGTTSYTETDPIFATHPSYDITSINITNWDTAFSWGNHIGLYRTNTWLPSWTDITNKPLLWDSTWSTIKNKPNFSTVATSGDYYDIINKPTPWDSSWVSIKNKPTFATVAISGNYYDLLNTPTIPAAQVNSDWNSSGGMSQILNKPVLFDGTWSSLTGKPSLSTVATSGNYNDLSNKPTIPASQVNSDWNSSSGLSQILNKPVLFDGTWVSLNGKPSFSTVATSGSYNDLLDKPILFNGTWASLTGKPALWDSTWNTIRNKPNFATVATSGSYNDLSNKPTIPSAQVNSDWNSSSGLSQILNKPVLFDGTWSNLTGKPSLSTVATSGSYNDLSNLPAPYIAGAGIQFTGSSINVNLNLSVSSAGDTLRLTPGNYVIIPGISANNSNIQLVSNPIITGITPTSAICNYTILSNTASIILSRGVCWDTTGNPTINNNHTTETGGTGSFSSNITSLLPNKIYYVRAYATNSNNIYYSNQTAISSLSTTATLITADTSNITQTTAVCGGDIIYNGGVNVTERGVCWSTSTNPTISNNKIPNGSGNGSFVSNLNNLQPNTTYYVRAYAINSAGTSYGNNVSFTTKGALPTVTTDVVQGITITEAVPNGTVIASGSSSVTERGFCWSITNPNPTIFNNKKSVGSGTGSYNALITFLLPDSTYYIRSYAINSHGISYGNVVAFTTSSAYYDSFEAGMPNGWNGNWSLSYSNQYDGFKSLYSDQTNDTVSITRTITSSEGGYISFRYLATNYHCNHGSYNADTPTRTYFYIDDVYIKTCNSTTWSITSVHVSAGTHTFKWINKGREGTQYSGECWNEGMYGQAWIDYFICAY